VERWVARLAVAEGDHAGAIAALAQARVVLADPSDLVRAQLSAEEFRIAIALAPDDADALLPELPADCAAGLLRATFALQRNDPALAVEVLSGLEPRTIREQVEWELLSGLGAQHRNLDEAHAHLATALTIAQPHRYLSTVIQSGAGIGDLLRSMPRPPGLTVYVDELVAAAEDYRVRLGTAARAQPNGLLTSRQYAVLRLLSSRLTTNEIAATLYVSPNTLKTHMRTIYQKLQVNSRADAVREAHARQLL
jgi:LuxR family transcriptional regulator, maltose regulon positive regulatory protein